MMAGQPLDCCRRRSTELDWGLAEDATKAETNHDVEWFNLSLAQSSVLMRNRLFYHPFSRQIAKFNALAKLTQTR
jgi:hypothetical protein